MDVSPDESPAKARHSRWKSLAPIAALALLAAGFGTWQLLDRDGSDNDVHVTGPGSASTGPVLEWTEFDPGFDEDALLGILEPLGDGRILVKAFGEDYDGTEPGYRFLITENGIDWSEVPMPEGASPLSHDLSGDRWLVAGYDFGAEPHPATGEPDDNGSEVLSRYQAFFSDDQGANWTEVELDFSSSSVEVPSPYEYLPLFVTAALTSEEHMVIVLQGEEAGTNAGPDSSTEMSSESEEDTQANLKSWIFASDGGVFEQVAEYHGQIARGGIGMSFSTPAGFSLQLYVEGETDQEPARLSTLTSPDGRIWSESKSASVTFTSAALGPDGSLWRTVWLGTRYGLHRFDREGTLTTKVAFDNSLPFLMTAGPSGVAVNAMTIPGTDLFTLPNKRIAKGGYELRLNEPEGGFTLWDLSAGVAVYECQREVLWAQGADTDEEAVCEFTYPEHDNADMDAVVLVFEDGQTGDRLVSFTRRELLPSFPVGNVTGLAVDSPEGEEHWLGWSADGADWWWQSAADAFGIDPSEANEATVWLTVGDGFLLARVQQYDDSAPYYDSTRWFIAQVP